MSKSKRIVYAGIIGIAIVLIVMTWFGTIKVQGASGPSEEYIGSNKTYKKGSVEFRLKKKGSICLVKV